MNEVHAEAGCMTAEGVGHVVSELVLLLVPQDRESGDGGDELIVAKRLAAGDGAGRGAKRKGQSEAQIGIARFGEVQTAGIEDERA